MTDALAPPTLPRPEIGRRSRLGLAGIMAVAGVAHFVIPSFYERIIPR